MSQARGQYYEVVRTSRVVIRGNEHDSRSRSHDRKYRRENRDDGYHRSSYAGESAEYAVRSSGGDSYGRRSTRQPIADSHSHHGHGGASEYDESKAVLAVFNLNLYTTEAELYDVFAKFGPIKKATIVLDAKTGRSRGFGFVYFESTEDARVAHTEANGMEIGDRPIRVDYSATEKPHDPTPGVYYGRVSYPKRGGGYGGGGPPRGPPVMGAPAGGHYHCQGCEMEARERERWEREARRYGNGSREYYYQDRYAAAPEYPRGRDRSAMSRPPRSDYYRGGAGVR